MESGGLRASLTGTRLALLGFGALLSIAMLAGILLFKGMTGTEFAVIPWGTMVIGYVFFAVMSGGIADSTIIAAFTHPKPSEYKLLKRNLFTALAVLIPGIVLVFSDLLHIEKSIWIYLGFNPTSRIAWNGVLYILYASFLALLLLLLIRRGEEAASTTLGRILALLVLATSLSLEMNLGMAFGSNIAIPMWYGIYSGLLLISSAFVLGAAWLSLSRAKSHPEEVPKLSLELAIATAVLGFISFWGGILSLYNWCLIRGFVYELVGGSLAAYFLGGYVLLGLVAPIVLGYLAYKKKSAPLLILASILAIAGVAIGLAVPYNYGGQEYRLKINEFYAALAPVLGGEHISVEHYLVNPETLAFIGGFGLAVLIDTLGSILLPLEPGEKPRRLWIFK